MDDTKSAWDEVGKEFAKLGEMISERYKAAGDGEAAKVACRRAADELDRAFTSLGEALNDPEVREHLRESGDKLGDALKATFNDVGERVRRTVSST